MELYPGRDTFVFDQGDVNKNQPITLLVLLPECEFTVFSDVERVEITTIEVAQMK